MPTPVASIFLISFSLFLVSSFLFLLSSEEVDMQPAYGLSCVANPPRRTEDRDGFGVCACVVLNRYVLLKPKAAVLHHICASIRVILPVRLGAAAAAAAAAAADDWKAA